jgi:hypothetical protein
MTLSEKINALQLPHHTGDDVMEMLKDIYHYFNQLDSFELLDITRTKDASCLIKAKVLSTMQDPFFSIVVKHTWISDLAFDNEWHSFTQKGEDVLFEFVTWEDDYIAGQIYFERVKAEKA